MTYIVLIIFVLTGLQALIALSNYLFRVDYSLFRTQSNAFVSIVIPVRNEEKNIGNLLDDLKKQDYEQLQIIVVNDDSTDKTAEIVRTKSETDGRILLVHSQPDTENGWLGKNRACFEGAKQAAGQYLLFLDADVRISGRAIRSVIGYFQKSNVVFLSIFPKQLLPSCKTAAVIPIMNYILLSFLPLFLVRKSKFVSLAAANGQFMLFDAEVYRAFEPHQLFRSEKVEDIRIARFMKRKKFKIACLTGNEDISCKMYETYDEAMEGFSKNVIAFFGNSFLLAVSCWLLSFFGIVFIALVTPFYFSLIYIALLSLTRTFIALASKQPVWLNILLHYVQLYNMGILIFTSLIHTINKSYQWKGRTIS